MEVSMWWPFGKTREYNRNHSLHAASNAAGKGNVDKAIEEYKKVLKASPDDEMVQNKIALLYAEKGKLTDARVFFKVAAEGYRKKGFPNKAIAVYVQALRYMYREPDIYDKLSDLYLNKGQKMDAIKTLMGSRKYFAKTADADKLQKLLRKAFTISPWQFDVTIELVSALKRCRRKSDALELLTGLAGRETGKNLKKVRSGIFFLSPSIGNAWRWLRA